MREIKFRAWLSAQSDDPTEGIMFPPEQVQWVGHGEALCDGDCMEIGDDLIIEQYTGLHDKNGKEIYEGDILRGGMLDEACCVEWQDNTGQYVAWGEHYNVYGHRFDQFEVIGNIHENPELLA